MLDNRPVFVGVWLPPVENMRDKPVPQEPNDEPIIISGGCAPRCIGQCGNSSTKISLLTRIVPIWALRPTAPSNFI